MIYRYEAMDASGQEIRDTIKADSSEEAQARIRKMGFFVTKISSTKSERTVTADAANEVRSEVADGFSRAVIAFVGFPAIVLAYIFGYEVKIEKRGER